MLKNKYSRKIAFTLAEVLVTLGIIGVVAAITMPTLIDNHQKKSCCNKVGKILFNDEPSCISMGW